MTATIRPYPPPTAQVEPYVRALGTKQAVRFILTFGGSQVYIPVGLDPNNEVVELIGMDGTIALTAIRDTLPKRVPLAKSWIAHCLLAEGLSVNDVARTLHVSDTAVRNMIRRAEARQEEMSQRAARKAGRR